MALAVGLLIARVVIGLTLAGHGVQKLFGWFDGPGLIKFTGGLKAQGYKPAWLWVFFVCLGEIGGGLSLASGLLTPLGAAGIVGAMCMAIVKVHWKNGFWNGKRGIEFPLALLAVAVQFGIAGPGDYSLDVLLKLNWPGAQIFGALAVAALIVDVIGILMTRQAAPAPVSAPAPTPAPAQTEPRATS
jgi:putative oxidoreductase